MLSKIDRIDYNFDLFSVSRSLIMVYREGGKVEILRAIVTNNDKPAKNGPGIVDPKELKFPRTLTRFSLWLCRNLNHA